MITPNTSVAINMPDHEYRSVDAVSRSELCYIVDSPKHFKWALENGDDMDETAAAIGRVTHDLFYKPTTANSRIIICPEYNAKSSIERKAHKEFVQSQDKASNVISQSNLDLCKRMVDTLHSDATAMSLLSCHHRSFGSAEDASEVSIFAEYEVAGFKFPFKCRLDFCGDGFINDLKTTNKTPTAKNFKRTCWDYDYGFQAGFYSLVYQAAGLGLPEFTWTVVSKEDPIDVVVFQLSKEDLIAESNIVLRALKTYGECKRDDFWPGIGEFGKQILSLR